MGYLPLENYGIIGNHASAALVSRLGSIDWCCLPYLDSGSHFGAILDENQGGRFQVAPVGEFRSEQRYLARTQVLQTEFETPQGRAILTDWMPLASGPGEGAGPADQDPVIHRRIEMIDGKIEWQLVCTPRFNYGNHPAQAEWHDGGILFRGSLPEELVLLQSSVPLEIAFDGGGAEGRFTLRVPGYASTEPQLSLMPDTDRFADLGLPRRSGGPAAQLEIAAAHFSWSWGRRMRRPATASTSDATPAPTPDPSPEATMEAWREITHRCSPQGCIFAGPWHDAIARASSVLRLLINPFSGSISEAVTTSLPGMPVGFGGGFGGGALRTGDYRYSTIRNASLTLQALRGMGYEREAREYFAWIGNILVRDGAEGLQPIYTLDGGKFLSPEHEAVGGHGLLRGARGASLPWRQFQLDIYGHVMLAADEHFRAGLSLPEPVWAKLGEIADYVCQAWRRPDHGSSGARARPEHYVYSKVLCWAALDRAIRLHTSTGRWVPAAWKRERDVLHRTVCEQGFDVERNTFLRSFGDRELDASALIIPLVGFLPPDDPRVQGTIWAIQTQLSDGVLIFEQKSPEIGRYAQSASLWSSFLFVSALALSGRADEAGDRLAELCSYGKPLGLFGEFVDATRGETTGNYPSAATHLAAVNAAINVAAARGRRVPSYRAATQDRVADRIAERDAQMAAEPVGELPGRLTAATHPALPAAAGAESRVNQ